MRFVNFVSPIVCACVAVLLPSTAHCFCRTTICANTDPKTRPTECDNPSNYDPVTRCYSHVNVLHWEQPCFSFSAQSDGSKKYGITARQLEELTQQCFDTWQTALCPGGGTPNVQIEAFPMVECSESRYNTRGPNQNVLVFHDDVWPDPKTASSVIALTSVHFDPVSGQIYDVDLEFNSAVFTFELESASGGVDLQSVIQHESGHFLGLADLYAGSSQASTMYWDYGGSSNIAMRTLEPDDIAGVCTVFPPAATVAACDPTPRHGFTTKCSEPADEGCSCRLAGHGYPTRPCSWFAVGMGLVMLRRRRNR
jgi:hypothetical protein